MSFPRYPKYKDSGVEWLGEVPEHWQVSKLGFEAWVRARLGWKGLKAEEYVSDGFAFLSTPNIKSPVIDFLNVNFISEARYAESPEIILRSGDVLLAKDGSTLGTVNVVRDLPRPSTVNSSIAVISPGPRLEPVFLFYLLSSSFMRSMIDQAKGGMGVPHLFQSDLNKFWVILPTAAEQENIAAFLDRETAKIDELVVGQQRLMELLKEKRQAVISHAVTKGLNPDAPMKPSGVEWLGEVPTHWEVMPLKRDLAFLTSGSRGWADNYSDDGEIFLRIGNLTRDSISIDLTDIQRVRVSEDTEGARTKVQAGDVLFSITADLGSVAIVDESLESAYVSQHVALARLNQSHLLPEWVGYTALSVCGRTWIERQSYGGTKIQLSLDDIRDMPVAVPPLAEQNAINGFLRDYLTTSSLLTQESAGVIRLLGERRSALISAAVTGQIDVRHLAQEAGA